jgi:hypothetical protein
MHAGRVSVLTVADCAAHIPRGGAIGQAVGGAMAWTAEEDALWSLEHAIVMSAWAAAEGKGKRPEKRPYPEGTAAEAAKRDRVIAQAKAFRARRALKT